MKKKLIIPLILALLLLGSCTPAGQILDGDGMVNSYTQISQDEAKKMMQADDGHIILDVRRQDEFDAGHIPGAVCIPNESIEDTPPAGLPDLNQIILVYCRSGRRSKEAAQKLFDMGYTRVYEFGGIIDWIGETMKNEEDHSMDPIAIPGLLVGDRYYTFDFESNSSADALFEKIKKETLTVVMHDQDSSGKIGDLPWELPANDFEMTAEPGNIILCAGGRIMLCYGESTGSYTKLGSIGDVTGEELSEVLGAGDVTAEFSVEWTE